MKTNASTWKKWGLFLIIVLALMVIPSTVAADTYPTTLITAQDVNQYSISANNNHYIYSIVVDSLPMGTNQTHTLNSNGATFLLKINTWNDYYIYNNFEITMTYPDGNTSTITKTVTRVSGLEYKTTIQPVFTHIQQVTNVYWTIDLQVGTAPAVTAEFNSPPAAWDPSASIPFTSASGIFSGGEKTTIYAYEISTTGFEDTITDYDPWGNLSILGEFFAWSWEAVIAFINMIPIIGPIFITITGYVGSILGTAIFWVGFIIINSWLIIGGLEIIILMMAFTILKRPTPEKVLGKMVYYNVETLKLLAGFIGTVYYWSKGMIETISGIIQALKPI